MSDSEGLGTGRESHDVLVKYAPPLLGFIAGACLQSVLLDNLAWFGFAFVGGALFLVVALRGVHAGRAATAVRAVGGAMVGIGVVLVVVSSTSGEVDWWGVLLAIYPMSVGVAALVSSGTARRVAIIAAGVIIIILGLAAISTYYGMGIGFILVIIGLVVISYEATVLVRAERTRGVPAIIIGVAIMALGVGTTIVGLPSTADYAFHWIVLGCVLLVLGCVLLVVGSATSRRPA